jgi:hypothetical protein
MTEILKTLARNLFCVFLLLGSLLGLIAIGAALLGNSIGPLVGFFVWVAVLFTWDEMVN